MRYVPGSNHGPLLPHRPLTGDPRIHAIECSTSYFDESAAVARPVSAGRCTLHAGRTLHVELVSSPLRDASGKVVAGLKLCGKPASQKVYFARAY